MRENLDDSVLKWQNLELMRNQQEEMTEWPCRLLTKKKITEK